MYLKPPTEIAQTIYGGFLSNGKMWANQSKTFDVKELQFKETSLKHYPIGEFISRTMQERGLSTAEFIRVLGYQNLNKGLRRLDALLQRGEAEGSFIYKLRQLGVDEAELEDSLSKTQVMLEIELTKKNKAEENITRQNFQPYLIPEVEHQRPSQFCISALCGGMSRYKKYFSNDFQMLSKEEKAVSIQKVIRHHYSQNKRTLFNGAILGYLYMESFDSKAQRFSVEGVYMGEGGEVRLDEPKLFLGKKKWVGIFDLIDIEPL